MSKKKEDICEDRYINSDIDIFLNMHPKILQVSFFFINAPHENFLCYL